MIHKRTPVAQVMTKDVITLNPDSPMMLVAEIFETHNFHHIPILNKKGKIKGILSRTEFHKLLHGFTVFNLKSAAKFNKEVFQSVTAGEVMTKQVATLYPDDNLETAMGYFRENLFHAAPVINRQTRELEGIVTTFDLLNFIFQKEILLT